MKLYNMTIILFIISLIFMTIGLIMKSKKIRKIGFGIMIFIAFFWIVFVVWVFYDMAEEEERHFGKEDNTHVENIKSYEDDKSLKNCYYKYFNITFKNGFDLTKNMIYKDKIYHMVIDNYQEYYDYNSNRKYINDWINNI